MDECSSESDSFIDHVLTSTMKGLVMKRGFACLLLLFTASSVQAQRVGVVVVVVAPRESACE